MCKYVLLNISLFKCHVILKYRLPYHINEHQQKTNLYSFNNYETIFFIVLFGEFIFFFSFAWGVLINRWAYKIKIPDINTM